MMAGASVISVSDFGSKTGADLGRGSGSHPGQEGVQDADRGTVREQHPRVQGRLPQFLQRGPRIPSVMWL
jgi:hypothetical protein